MDLYPETEKLLKKWFQNASREELLELKKALSNVPDYLCIMHLLQKQLNLYKEKELPRPESLYPLFDYTDQEIFEEIVRRLTQKVTTFSLENPFFANPIKKKKNTFYLGNTLIGNNLEGMASSWSKLIKNPTGTHPQSEIQLSPIITCSIHYQLEYNQITSYQDLWNLIDENKGQIKETYFSLLNSKYVHKIEAIALITQTIEEIKTDALKKEKQKCYSLEKKDY